MDGFLLLVGGSWLALQVMALGCLRGAWRKAALLSAAVMLLAVTVATLGVLAGSDLAPIWVVFALPVCLAWIAALWLVRGVVWLIAR